MLENYERLKNGVIKQIGVRDFNYDEKYVTAYDKLDCDRMSQLRFHTFLKGYLNISRRDSVLDFGYGNGNFLSYASSQGLYAYGYDITGYRPPNMHYGVKILEGDYSGWKNNYFTVATFWDSLEHCKDISFVKDLKVKYAVVSLPCCKEEKDFTDDWFDGWSHRKPNEHLWHFSVSSLKMFMHESGFRYVAHSFAEDEIRKSDVNKPNILTGIFEKK